MAIMKQSLLALWLLALALLSGCIASVVDFDRIDVRSPGFDVDMGLSASQRWLRLQAAGSVPLKGWNSYDGWDWSVTEKDVVAHIDFIAANLSSFGYNIVTIDWYWYLDLDAHTMYIDKNGRVQPDANRFPSAAGGAGFKQLAAYAHSKGLLFGIHTMRGVSVTAVTAKSPVLGSNYTAADVYDPNEGCTWPTGDPRTVFYSLKMSHPAAQLFYDALYAQYAEWGLDFIKNDCVYQAWQPLQIDAVAAAIEHSGRRMFLSLSPGTDDNGQAARIVNETSAYRVTDDTWDRWDNIRSHFLSAQHMQPYIAYPHGRYGLPAWPDLDMLPLGYLGNEGINVHPLRWCGLTQDEQVTLMSLWTIFRSPLIYGGDLQHPDNFSLSLLTNVEALAITDNSTNTDFIVSDSSLAIWRSDSTDWRSSGISYFTVHNLADTPLNLTVSSRQLRGKQTTGGTCSLRDVWRREDLQRGSSFAVSLRPHASGLYSLHSCSGQHPRQRHKTSKP